MPTVEFFASEGDSFCLPDALYKAYLPRLVGIQYTLGDRILQRLAADVRLPDDLLKPLRPVF